MLARAPNGRATRGRAMYVHTQNDNKTEGLQLLLLLLLVVVLLLLITAQQINQHAASSIDKLWVHKTTCKNVYVSPTVFLAAELVTFQNKSWGLYPLFLRQDCCLATHGG